MFSSTQCHYQVLGTRPYIDSIKPIPQYMYTVIMALQVYLCQFNNIDSNADGYLSSERCKYAPFTSQAVCSFTEKLAAKA